jgi:RNA polymerase sigma factor (sigma-70 family)
VDDAAQRFTAIYDEHYRRVLAYLLTRTDRQAAEDLAAETFTVVWRRLDDLPATPLPWLLGVARNLLRQQRRASGRREALAGRVSALTGPGDLTDRDVADEVVEGSEVRRALATLSERDREALTLVTWLDLAPRDAAGAVGCAPATFLVRLHRARRRLEKALRAGRGEAPEGRGPQDRGGAEPVPTISTREPA